jgi:putative membrane protein insertion efficiency factor
MRKIFAYPMLGLLWFYKALISPILSFFGVKCRHYPSCSSYSVEAIERHGPWAGGWMTLARLLRCHPFKALGATSGVDNVPQNVTTPPLWAPWRYGIWRGTQTDET